MIVTELYNGQGLGNQLWSYVVTRTLAQDRGFVFGIMNPDKFKGKDFMSLDFGKEIKGGSGPEGGPPTTLPEGIVHYYVEKDTWYEKNKCDIRDYDPSLLSIEDSTKIDGYFQSEKLVLHKKKEICEWLRVKPAFNCTEYSSNNICIMNVRGGEYKGVADLILPRKYWTDAAANMLRVNPKLEFVIITDDVKYANKILPEYKALHFDIGKDYGIVKNAVYLILANSSFSFFPAWTSETVKYIIAPKYWARHNVSDGFWACAFNLYRDWMWQDREGNLFTFEECKSEYERYKIEKNLATFGAKPASKQLSQMERNFRRLLDSVSKVKHRIMN